MPETHNACSVQAAENHCTVHMRVDTKNLEDGFRKAAAAARAIGAGMICHEGRLTAEKVKALMDAWNKTINQQRAELGMPLLPESEVVILENKMETIEVRNRLVEFVITGELLADFLRLPQGTRVVHVRDKGGSWSGHPEIIIRVESPSLPPVEEGTRIPTCSPSFEREEHEIKGRPLMNPGWTSEVRFKDWGLVSKDGAPAAIVDLDMIPEDGE